MKKYTNRIKLMPKFTKCMSLAMILTFTSYEEAFAEMSYAEQTSFTVSMENQTLKSVINWVEKNSQFILYIVQILICLVVSMWMYGIRQ